MISIALKTAVPPTLFLNLIVIAHSAVPTVADCYQC